MSVGRICNRSVDTAEPDESVQVAASRLHARKVGTLAVLDHARKPIGILTDRDLTVRVLADGKDAARTTVAEAMTPSPRTIREEMPIEDALAVMRSGPFRRILVVDDDDKLVGLLSLDDILDLLTEEFGLIGKLLREENPRSLGQI